VYPTEISKYIVCHVLKIIQKKPTKSRQKRELQKYSRQQGVRQETRESAVTKKVVERTKPKK
jgi:hypothetical protein